MSARAAIGFDEIVGVSAPTEVQTAGAGPAGRLPLTAEMLLERPSGDIFGWTQNAGMGWDPRELGRPQYLMLSTQGGIRAADGRPIALGYHTGHWEIGLLLQAAAAELKELGAIPFAGFCSDPCDGRTQGTTGMMDSLAYRNDAAIVLRRLARSLPTRKGVLGVATCDKGLPAMMMALAALRDLACVLVPGGVTLPPERGEDAGTVQSIGARFEGHGGTRRAARHIGPDGMSRRRESGMRQRHSERLADYLRGCGGSQELAPTTGRGAGTAQSVGRGFKGHLPAREPRPGGLDLTCVLAILRQQCDPTRDQHARQIVRARERHHHGGQALVAGGDTQHSAACRQRPDQPAEHGSCVISVRQGIVHAGSALRAAVAGVGAVGREWNGALRRQLLRRGFHEQPNFPVSGVVTESDRRSIRRADATVRAQNQKFLAPQLRRVPTHSGILAPAEEIAGGPLDEHFRGDGERSLRTRSFAADIVKTGIAGIEDGVRGGCLHRHNNIMPGWA